MNKKVLSLAVAAAIAAPMAAMADATVYGKVRQAVESYSMDVSSYDNNDTKIHLFGDEGANWDANADYVTSTKAGYAIRDAEYARIQNYASRIGVKGDEDLGNGLKAVYKMEFGIAISENSDEFGGSDPISARNAYVGLAGNFGTLLVGRHDTPLKMSTGALDYFGDTAADNNAAYTESLTDRRADGTVAYVSPNMSGLTLALAIVPGENEDADGLVDAYSVAAIYSNGGIHASAAYEGADGGIDALGRDEDAPGELKQYRFGLGYDAGNFKVGGVYEHMSIDANKKWEDVNTEELPEDADDADYIDWDTWVIGAAFIFGNNTLKAKYFDLDGEVAGSAVGHDGFAIGFDHNLSKRTQVYGIYVTADGDYVKYYSQSDIRSIQNGSYDPTDVFGLMYYQADHNVWGVGLNHDF
jgi:predicted porin